MNEEETEIGSYKEYLESELSWIETEKQSYRDCKLDYKKLLRNTGISEGSFYEDVKKSIQEADRRISELSNLEIDWRCELKEFKKEAL